MIYLGGCTFERADLKEMQCSAYTIRLPVGLSEQSCATFVDACLLGSHPIC